MIDQLPDLYGNQSVICDDVRQINTQINRNAARETMFEYDELNRQTKRTLPYGKSEATSYDSFASVAQHTDFIRAHSSTTLEDQGLLMVAIVLSSAAGDGGDDGQFVAGP
jgi:hypothetical protein